MTPLLHLDELQFLLIEYNNILYSYEDSLEYLTPAKKKELEREIEKLKLKLLDCMTKISIYDSKI